MKVAWAFILSVALASIHAEEAITSTQSSPSPLTPDVRDSADYKKLLKETDPDSLLPNTTPSLDLLNPVTPTTPKPTQQQDEKDQEKEEAQKNWLETALFDKKNSQANGTQNDKFSQLRLNALKALSKVPETNSQRTAEAKNKTTTQEQSDRTENSDNPRANLANLQTWKPADTGAAGAMIKFTPAITAFSSDSTKPLASEAEKAYQDKSSPFQAIQPVAIPLTSPSFVFTPIQAITPIESSSASFPSFNSFSPSNLGVTAPTPTTLPSLAVAKIETALPAQFLSSSVSHSSEAPHIVPLATTSLYKSKVADPNDYLNR